MKDKQKKKGIKKNTREETDRNDEKAIKLIEMKMPFAKARQKKILFTSRNFGTQNRRRQSDAICIPY
jgi:hypothetical protein